MAATGKTAAVSAEEITSATRQLVEANDNHTLRAWIIRHWRLLNYERLHLPLTEAGLSRERLAALQVFIARARQRGLLATALELVPLSPELIRVMDQYLDTDSWAERLFLLRRHGPQLTSDDAKAYLYCRKITQEFSVSIDDGVQLCLVTRDKGIDFARNWAMAQLWEQSQGSIPRLANYALKQLLVIPLTERNWAPITETEWAMLLRKYQRGVEVWGDVEDGLRFFIELLRSAEWAPNSVVELSLVIADLYCKRPPVVNSDRAHNVELALSYAMRALQGVDLGYAPEARGRAHERLGQIYAIRLQQDPVEALGKARQHFSAALDAYDPQTMIRERAYVSRLIGWSMTELARRSFDAAARRRALDDAIQTLRQQCRTHANRYADVDLADALALYGEFDPASLVEAMELIEAVVNSTAGDRPPAVRMVPSAQHETNVEAVRRWAYCRYIYAGVAARRRALEPQYDISRAIQEIDTAEPYLADWGITGERPSGSELHGDLLMQAGRWQQAIEAYGRSSQTPFPYAPARYDPFTVQGLDAVATGASQIDAKTAYCYCRLGDPMKAVLLSDRSKTLAILTALYWEDLAKEIPEGNNRDEFLAALAEVRSLEGRSRQAIQELGERPDTETGWRLIEARSRLREIAAGLMAENSSEFELTPGGVSAAIPARGVLIVPLITPIGSAFVALRRRKQASPAVDVTYTGLTVDYCRDALGRYGQLLDGISRGEALEESLRNLEQLLGVLSEGPARDLRQAAIAAGAKRGTPLRFVSQIGVGALPLHAATPKPGQRTLCEDYVYSSIPSIGVVARRHKQQPAADRRPKTLIVVNPTNDLPYAMLEGHLVAVGLGTAKSRIVPGPAATRDTVMKLIRNANLHFAGHAAADLSAPWRSFLQASDGSISAADIAGGAASSLGLVTISACEAGFSDFKRAPNELGGLPTAFLMSGARAVVASLWPVHDIPAALLMGEFYRVMHLGNGGAEIIRALRRAELWLRSASSAALEAWTIKQEKRLPPEKAAHEQFADIRQMLREYRGKNPPFSHPYYWAGFIAVTC